MDEISSKILQQLYSLSVQPEVNISSSIASISGHTGSSNDSVNDALITLENARYIDTFRTKADANYSFILRLTKKGFDYSNGQGWSQKD